MHAKVLTGVGRVHNVNNVERPFREGLLSNATKPQYMGLSRVHNVSNVERPFQGWIISDAIQLESMRFVLIISHCYCTICNT